MDEKNEIFLLIKFHSDDTNRTDCRRMENAKEDKLCQIF